ncbi:hypothetical protein RND71_025852 [Anisodus tanguticus]|uniref:VQ domain-containing protein n=1 Tax=Anisodus tanguticus TaxID=243964 RepID=A0AAE1RMN6_9SOLA|nr:hypothetical protein RND71_025852 [Anisodus tanguticus]
MAMGLECFSLKLQLYTIHVYVVIIKKLNPPRAGSIPVVRPSINGSFVVFYFFKMEQGKKGKNSSRRNNYKKKEPMKVKYISSPVMVNAKNAAEFRSIVQELTGKSPETGGTIDSSGGSSSVAGGGWPKYHDRVEYNSSTKNILMNNIEIDNNDEYFWKQFSESL